jgi:hypothetical protein
MHSLLINLWDNEQLMPRNCSTSWTKANFLESTTALLIYTHKIKNERELKSKNIYAPTREGSIPTG